LWAIDSVRTAQFENVTLGQIAQQFHLPVTSSIQEIRNCEQLGETLSSGRSSDYAEFEIEEF
jgi:hypothetical protein